MSDTEQSESTHQQLPGLPLGAGTTTNFNRDETLSYDAKAKLHGSVMGNRDIAVSKMDSSQEQQTATNT